VTLPTSKASLARSAPGDARRSLSKALVAELPPRRLTLLKAIQAHAPEHAGRFRELDLSVIDDLDVVAPRIVEGAGLLEDEGDAEQSPPQHVVTMIDVDPLRRGRGPRTPAALARPPTQSSRPVSQAPWATSDAGRAHRYVARQLPVLGASTTIARLCVSPTQRDRGEHADRADSAGNGCGSDARARSRGHLVGAGCRRPRPCRRLWSWGTFGIRGCGTRLPAVGSGVHHASPRRSHG